MIDNVAQFPTKLDRLVVSIKGLLVRDAANRKEWVEIKLNLCAELADARTEFRADRTFGDWCGTHFDISRHDREAYIAMGRDLELAREVLENTDRKSIRHICENEFKPRRGNVVPMHAEDVEQEQAAEPQEPKALHARTEKATFKTAKAAVEDKPPVFDERCAELFGVAAHLNLFRKLVTGKEFRAYLPVEQQFEFAKHVLEKIEDTRGPPDDLLMAKRLRNECWVQLENALATPRMVIKRDPDPPYRFEMAEGMEQFRRAALSLRRAADVLQRALSKGEVFNKAQSLAFEENADLIDRVMEALLPYRNRYAGEGRDAI